VAVSAVRPCSLLFGILPSYLRRVACCLCAAEKAHYAARDPITQFKKYVLDNGLATEADLKAIDNKIDELVEEAVDFADESPLPVRSQLLENVFADPRGFGIGPDGRYRHEDPSFTAGTAQV
jgi:pyruvate dehydrogenase E1 component alpha subunit